MRKSKIFLVFLIVFINIFSSEIIIPNETSKMKLINSRISEKESELKKLKELKKEIQEKKDNARVPIKVGLVLSGGGAKGIAHIGVLKELEKYGIEVDYITGTSFGSIVGALYAIGYTPDEIEKLLLAIDWESYKDDNQDRRYTSLKYKVQKEKYFFNLEVDDNYSLKIPKGVLTGEAFYLELKKMFLPAEGVTDFDDFPIPFRAISANINDGSRNVVGEGDLAKAVFMSMALPTIFDPVEDNGEYYVDGGLIENLPVQDVIDMGADVVIAVDITAETQKIDKNSNVFEILEKLTSYKGDEQFEKAKKLADILIIPDVKKHSTADFTGLEELVKKGEIETIKHEKEIKDVVELQKLDKNNELFNKKEITNKKKLEKPSKIKINELILTGNDAVTKEKIEYLSRKKLPAEYSEEEFEEWMKRIKAIDIVDRFFYTVKDGKLSVKVVESEEKYLRLGLNFSSDYGPVLRVATEMKKYGLFDNEYMVMLEASENPKIEFETITDYTYRDTTYIGLFNAGFGSSPLFIYKKEDKVATYDNYSLFLSAGLGTSILNSYLFATKFYYIGIKNKYKTGSQDMIDKTSWEYLKNKTVILTDTRDDPYFSVKGAYNRGELFIGTSLKDNKNTEFYGGVLDLHKYIPLSKNLNIEIFGSGGKMFGGYIPENEYLKLGGLRSNQTINSFSFYGMNAMRKHTEEFYLGGIKLRHKLSKKLYLNLQYNVVTYRKSKFKSLDDGMELGKDYKHGVGVGVAVDSFFGPLEFVLSNDADAKGVLVSMFLGYEF